MLIVIPTATDAPCYHFPFATIGMIALNIFILILQFAFPEAAAFFILRHAIFNPITWFSSCCMHAGVGHLFGNMVGLALCGLIIEGKVGWWKFIAIYFGIGVSANAFEHIVMFWISNSGSLGASGVIFGMLAIIMIWAPENKVNLTYCGLLLFYPVFGTITVSIVGFCFFMIGMELLTVWFSFFKMSSAMLHMIGVMPGLVIGYVMVKKRMVDCEGYDLKSVHSGREGQRVMTIAQEREAKETRRRLRSEAKAAEQHGLKRVAAYIRAGHFEFAWKRFGLLRRKNQSLVLNERHLVAIINGLWSKPESKGKAMEVMDFYLKTYTTLRVPIVLNQARFMLESKQRPRQCMKLMRQIDGQSMTGKQLRMAEAIIKKARRKIGEGVLDVAEF